MAYRLPNDIATKLQLEQLLRELRLLSESQLAKSSNQSDLLQQFLAINSIGTLSPSARDKLVAGISNLLRTAPQLSLVLADLPTGDDLIELVGWLRSQLHPTLLIRLVQDSEIMAGCMVSTTSSLHHLSLRSALFANSAKLATELAK